MKPTLDMEGGKHAGNTAVVVQPETVNPGSTRKPQRNRIIVGTVIGLTTVLVITVTVVLAVYLGIWMTRDSYKDAWKTYQTKDGQSIVQKTEVKKDEVDITVANEMKVIYDYKNDLHVIRMKNPETGRFVDCFVRPLNHTETDNIQEEGNVIENGKVVNEYVVQYKITTNRVPAYRISDSVRDMCQGGGIYWLERIMSENKVKRRVSGCPTTTTTTTTTTSGCCTTTTTTTTTTGCTVTTTTTTISR